MANEHRNPSISHAEQFFPSPNTITPPKDEPVKDEPAKDEWVTLNPANLKENERQLLGKVFTDYAKNDLFLPDSTYVLKIKQTNYHVSLTNLVIKRNRSKLQHEHEVRFEPMGARIGNGVYGETCQSTGAIAVDSNHEALLANANKQRVVKNISIMNNETEEQFKARVNNEYTLAKLAGNLSPKPPVFYNLPTGERGAIITMRKVGEFSLAELIRNSDDLSFKERCELSIEVMRAIDELIKKGIIHRDLNTGNIRISYKNGKFTATIIDFGLAELASTEMQTPSTKLVGSLLHSPPEVLEHCQYSHASDVFATGKILWEIWGGREAEIPVHIRKMEDRHARRQKLIDLVREENKFYPLRGLFNGIPKLNAPNKNDIRAQLNKLTDSDPEKRGTTLQSYINEFKKISLSNFFTQDIGRQIMHSLEKNNKDSLKTLLSKVDHTWFVEDNLENRLIKTVLDYLKKALSQKNRNFLAFLLICAPYLKNECNKLSRF
jgi:serine/threonine protein kinase